ncbi:MAG: leucine-rich repeat domain-containing protein [Salinivirgaceae bacterium]|nr:leucine-rich repeat domain-containing protein [Salinivirgaceae bacterium]
MKRIFTILFAAMLAGQAWAQTSFEVGNLKYTVTDETNHYVSVGKAETKPTGALNIPEKVTNPDNSVEYSVTSIGSGAFSGCSGLTSVSIPNSVTSIGGYAFQYCEGLTEVTISNSVTNIDNGSFSHCSGLTAINVGSANINYLSENGVLFNKDKTTIVCCPAGKTGTYTIPNSVTSIGCSAFSGCSGLTSVTIPNSVTSIGDYAFGGCSGLTSITIPNSVTSIGDYAFCFCRNLTSISFPNSVTSIGVNAFYECNNLTKAEFASIESLCGIRFGWGDATNTSLTIHSNPLSIAKHLYINGEEVTEVIIPNSVTSIKGYTFAGCSSLTSITIPNSVKSIGRAAFYNCSGLTSINIPNSVTSIIEYAFCHCNGLTTIDIPSTITRIDDYTFAYCSGLTSINIPNSVERIYKNAFRECNNLMTVTIPKSVTNIDYTAFYSCSGLTEIVVDSDNPQYTSENDILFNKDKTALICCPARKTGAYTIPNTVTSISHYAFYRCDRLSTVTIPNSVTSIGVDAFLNVKNVVYSGDATGSPWGALSVNGIVDGDFIYSDDAKTNLTGYIGKGGDVVIPKSVTAIGDYAFAGRDVTSVVFPDSLKTIRSNSFEGCDIQKTIVLPISIENYPSNAHYACLTFKITNDNEPRTVTVYRGSKQAFVKIPNSIIYKGQTYYVTDIDQYAFYYCKNLTEIIIPEGVTSIYYESFYGCRNLKSIFIPRSVTSISEWAFGDCANLATAIIPNTVTTITGSGVAFPSNTIVFCEAKNKPEGWSKNWHYGGRVVWDTYFGKSDDFEFVLNENYATLKKYKGNANTVSIPNAIIVDSVPYLVTYIDKEAFLDCENMKSVKLPAYLKGFGEYAFKNCTALESIVIPDSVSSIGDAAFYGCSSLKSIAFGKSVKTIGMSAFEKTSVEIVALPKNIRSIDNFSFAKCENLKLVYIPETVTNNEANAFVGCTNATIYCAAASQPETWSETWNANGGTVVWGYSVPADSTLELKFETNPNGTAQITGCGDVTTVDVPVMVMVDSSAYFVTGINGNAFIGGSWNLSSINVDERNQFLTSDDGVLFNKDKTTLIACPFKKNGIYTIPNTVTSIGDGAFLGCEGLQSIEIPNSVTEIGGWAFSGCAGLESITIPNSVTSIGDAAFRMCLGLTEITIPKSVVSMGSDVFAEHETPITVYCEVSRKPEGWDDNWDSVYGTTPCDVVWADNTPVTETAANAVNIYAHGNTIVVENATEEISVYDAMGRVIARKDRDVARHVSTGTTTITVNTPGVYVVKTGSTVKRVMVN